MKFNSYPYLVLEEDLQISINKNSGYNEYHIIETSIPSKLINNFKNEGIEEDFNQLDLVVEVNCTATMYRELFLFNLDNENKIKVKIKKNKVAFKFELQILILLKKELMWQGIKLNKGMPIGFLGNHKIDIDQRSTSLVEFKECKRNQEDINFMYKKHSIEIFIPSKLFKIIQKNKMKKMMNEFYKVQVKICLLEIFKVIENNNDSPYDQLNWYIELKNRWLEDGNSEEDFRIPEGKLNFINNLLKKPDESFLKIIDNEL